MFAISDVLLQVRSWGVSNAAQQVLVREPEIIASLKHARSLPPVQAGYRPTVVELLLDDLPYLRTVCGVPVYIRPCPDDYDPPFWELKFDGETALFAVKGEIVVNRVEAVADWLVGVGLLDSEERFERESR